MPDTERIIRACEMKKRELPMVRQAVISVELEGSEPITWNYAVENYAEQD